MFCSGSLRGPKPSCVCTTIVCIGVSTPLQKQLPLFYQAHPLPLNLQPVQVPPIYITPPYILVFHEPQPKNRIFQ